MSGALVAGLLEIEALPELPSDPLPEQALANSTTDVKTSVLRTLEIFGRHVTTISLPRDVSIEGAAGAHPG